MEDFVYQEGRLYAESVPLAEIAERYGTPCFVYSTAAVNRQVGELRAALAGQDYRICYAVKANGNLSVLRHLVGLGCGFDIVSGGELARVVAAGGDVSESVFSGVGKASEEIRAALKAGIGAFHVESPSELERISGIAKEASMEAPVSLRINPAVDVETHPYIATGFDGSKFGIPMQEALDLYRRAARLEGIRVRGVACHIGSQLMDVDPLLSAARQLVGLVDQLREEGIELEYIDVGGGLGIRYKGEPGFPLESYAQGLREAIGDRPLTLIMEPGRYVIGNAGALLTRVEYVKSSGKNCFVVVDAAMTELMRPAMYGSWHAILPAHRVAGREPKECDIVGPVCESADCLGRARNLAVEEGELLAVLSCGAYAAAMGSTYNSRPLAAEVMVDGATHELVRSPGRVEDLFKSEIRHLASSKDGARESLG